MQELRMKMILTYNITQMCGLAGVSYKTLALHADGEPVPGPSIPVGGGGITASRRRM